jgi:hypothetical protein
VIQRAIDKPSPVPLAVIGLDASAPRSCRSSDLDVLFVYEGEGAEAFRRRAAPPSA